MTYIRWINRGDDGWVGRTANGHDIIRIRKDRCWGGAIMVRLSNGSAERCKNIGHAKGYANELARLWNYPAFKPRQPMPASVS